MKAIFNVMTLLSLRFWYFTIGLVVVVLGLGGVAVSQLNQELLPPVSFPQTIILAQASGLSSEQVLKVVTVRLEDELTTIPEIVNLETTTTGAFGAVIIARNNFGVNQERLLARIQEAVNDVWLPSRHIQPAEGQDPSEFATQLLGQMTPEVLIFLSQRDGNFLFQLSPEVWAALPDETIRQTLAYLADQVVQTEGDALQQLVDQEIIPQLDAIETVANVNVSGGQALPGDESIAGPVQTSTRSRLLQLSPETWAIVAPKLGLSTLDQAAVTTLQTVEYPLPTVAPTLPGDWQVNHFVTAADLLEIRSLTTSIAGIFNDFQQTGQMSGALGQTDDLTPDDIAQMVAIDPTMVEYFEAEHLVAMSPEVFAALPPEFVANLDGFTRDAIAAKELARSITGQDAVITPVQLPSQWRIAPPQLITFSFADIPLATFSVSTRGGEPIVANPTPTETTDPVDTPTDETPIEQPLIEIPEGPALPSSLALLGSFIGVTLDTADDLINIQLPETFAAQLGSPTLSGAQLLNFLILLGDPENLPPGVQLPPIPLNPEGVINQFTPEAILFIAQYDPTFLPTLSPEIFNAFSDTVLSQPEIAPNLADVWSTLAGQPQFAERPLRNAADLIAIGNGQASMVLNTINSAIPTQFAGYEVRLFDSLSPAALRYFALNETDFYPSLEVSVLKKLSPAALAVVPTDFLSSLPASDLTEIEAIRSGAQPSAFTQLQEQYALDVPPADPNAPALNADWSFIGDFLGVELDTADDFSRFFPSTTNFLNSFFDSAQGRNFAPNLFGNLTPEAFQYIVAQDPTVLTGLRIEALQLLPETIVQTLPQEVLDRIEQGGTPFVPTDSVTRTNGNSSLLLTVFKTSEANTVQTFHEVEKAIEEIQLAHPELIVNVAFEQASFIEESIGGVAREGVLGALFAMVVILVFLSGGHWASRPRRITGVVMTVLFVGLLVWLVGSQAANHGGDINQTLANLGENETIAFFLFCAAIVIGLVIVIAPFSLPSPSWRATLVIGVSIPLSVLAALIGMRWLSPAVHDLLEPLVESSSFFAFLIRLFPETLTLNIMTLSGLTVAIGRVVDDSIVVLENIFRQMQSGMDKREAVLTGTRDVSLAIFVATVVTVVVFLPLGLTGGLIGEFFLPFGLAVTYSLLASFIVAITVVPLLVFIFIRPEDETEETQTILERTYLPVLNWSLSSRSAKLMVVAVALLSAAFGFVLFGGRPAAFLPDFGDPQIGVNVSLPSGTTIIQTNQLAAQLETRIREIVPAERLGTVQSIVGGGGLSLESLLTGGGVSENVAAITIGLREANADELNLYTAEIRTAAYEIFGEENATVSAASLSEQGFGGFQVVLSGPQEDLLAINDRVIETLSAVPGLTNVSGNLAQAASAGTDAPVTYIRIDRQTAVSYTGELETQNTIGVTQQAITAIRGIPDLPATIKVSQGFETETQVQGFQGLFVAMIIAIAIMIVILIFTFGSPVYWLAIIFSIVVAPVGAAIALTITDRVLGISALIGLLMLLGIVVTNAVVLIDRVHTNDIKKKMPLKEALMEAGERRLRPIVMTALATIMALMPLALGLSKGAIIASELGTVVIGGLFSSTLLTLIVVPIAYSAFHPIHNRIMGVFRRSKAAQVEPQGSSAD